ncbi:hypothetical protein BRARA_E00978 [Brassica rapa]|uniref:MADS-box domain-containing protein n=1 Tax=Brassica campestris TaxID=3711 RepID=A0A397Z888_BRACM|nr:hypothetical protein BRARA_E00978 [Brassica rapa]
MGQRKIKMEKVQDMNTRQVTFPKRRMVCSRRLASATLCNPELGIVVFSPGGNHSPTGNRILMERFY